MGIFSDIHTYLIISFLLMAFLLYKYAYRQALSGLDKKVDSVRESIKFVEEKKKAAEEEIVRLKREIAEANELLAKSISEAEAEAKKILQESGEIINEIVAKNEKECKNSIEKIKGSMSLELQNKIVELVIESITSRIGRDHLDKELQNTSIENATKMLEELAERYAKTKQEN